jgi:hypothetical protein
MCWLRPGRLLPALSVRFARFESVGIEAMVQEPSEGNLESRGRPVNLEAHKTRLRRPDRTLEKVGLLIT